MARRCGCGDPNAVHVLAQHGTYCLACAARALDAAADLRAVLADIRQQFGPVVPSDTTQRGFDQMCHDRANKTAATNRVLNAVLNGEWEKWLDFHA